MNFFSPTNLFLLPFSLSQSQHLQSSICWVRNFGISFDSFLSFATWSRHVCGYRHLHLRNSTNFQKWKLEPPVCSRLCSQVQVFDPVRKPELYRYHFHEVGGRRVQFGASSGRDAGIPCPASVVTSGVIWSVQWRQQWILHMACCEHGSWLQGSHLDFLEILWPTKYPFSTSVR